MKESELPTRSPIAGRPARERILRRLLLTLNRIQGPGEDFLRDSGYDESVETFLNVTLPQLSEGDLWWLSSRVSVALSNAEGRAAGREPFRPSDWRLLFYCLTGSRTFEEAIVRLGDLFDAVDGRFGSISLNFRGDLAVLRLSGKRSADLEASFVVALNGIAMYHTILTWMIGRPLGDLVEFDFDDSLRPLADEELLPFRLRLGCKHTAILFAPALLQAPILRSMEDCEQLRSLNLMMHMTDTVGPDEIVRQVKRILQTGLQRKHSLSNFCEIADELRMSSGTLRRRIRQAGTSFRALREEVRRLSAMALLSDPMVSIEDVAARLDFCDSDALRSATHKWVGMSPSEFRRSLLEG